MSLDTQNPYKGILLIPKEKTRVSLVSVKNFIFILEKGAGASNQPGQLVRAGLVTRARPGFFCACCRRPVTLQVQPRSRGVDESGSLGELGAREEQGESSFFCLLHSCFAYSSCALYLLHCCCRHYLWSHRFRILG